MAEPKKSPTEQQQPQQRQRRRDSDTADDRPGPTKGALDGQMGPDEISDPEEVVKNNEAKLHGER